MDPRAAGVEEVVVVTGLDSSKMSRNLFQVTDQCGVSTASSFLSLHTQQPISTASEYYDW